MSAAQALYRSVSSFKQFSIETGGLLEQEFAKNASLLDSPHVQQRELTSLVIIGASGDLSKRKIFPSLFRLFSQGYLPQRFAIVGYARSNISLEEFKTKIVDAKLDKSFDKGAELAERFLSRVHYVKGDYKSLDDIRALGSFLEGLEAPGLANNRLFYLAVPPGSNLRTTLAKLLAEIKAPSSDGWTRLIIEPPFLMTGNSLANTLTENFTESQVFRIDHYLGRDAVVNILCMRFANLVFEPVWNAEYIENIEVIFHESIGIEGHAHYFDRIGIVRDKLFTLMYMTALITMEQPVTLSQEDVRNERVKVLRQMSPLSLSNVVLGQYAANGVHVGYKDEPDVAPGSIVPTYVAAVLFLTSRRWAGVPFVLKVGRAMAETSAEIRVRFKKAPGFSFPISSIATDNTIYIGIRPTEYIRVRITTKVPGLQTKLEPHFLDLTYKTQTSTKSSGSSSSSSEMAPAYDRLLLDVMHGGNQALFIRADELTAAWKIVKPLVEEIDDKKPVPALYPFGSMGPEAELDGLYNKFSIRAHS
mmetsp:Transcript_44103/g.71805  ORF Transcript_44103/g.71805 Transcript_44103/m.71805 type:complete len:531 (-) Transcript_44103:231-1823(-)